MRRVHVKNKLISIIISAYNEQDNVGELYKQLQSTLKPLTEVDFEFIYVDDGSTDNTYANCIKKMNGSKSSSSSATSVTKLP